MDKKKKPESQSKIQQKIKSMSANKNQTVPQQKSKTQKPLSPLKKNVNNTNATKNKKIQQRPMTQQQIRLDKQKKIAFKRLAQLEHASQQAQTKKSTFLLETVVQNIQQDILKSNVQISQHPRQLSTYLIKKKQKQITESVLANYSEENHDKQFKNLLDRKERMFQQLKNIQQKELQMKKSSIQSQLFSSPNHKHNRMPQLTPEVKQHWMKIRQIVKQHEENSKKNYDKIQKKLAKERQEQLELQDKRNKEKSEEKRKILEKKIQQIQKRNKERTFQIQQEKRIVERLKNKKKLFQKMEENWKNTENQQKIQKQAVLLENYLEKRNVNMRELKEYQKAHDQKFRQQEEKRKMKMAQSKISSTVSFHRSRHSVDVLQENRKNKEIQQEKIHQIKQLLEKKREYATTLKQKFKPKMKFQSKISEPTQVKSLKQRSISAFELKRKGNQYMNSIHSSFANLKRVSIQNKNVLTLKQSQKKEYKDYIKQLRMNRTNDNNTSGTNKQMDLINTIMKKPNSSTQEKFFQAQMITKKMESGGTSKHLLNSINAKLQILKKLSYKE